MAGTQAADQTSSQQSVQASGDASGSGDASEPTSTASAPSEAKQKKKRKRLKSAERLQTPIFRYFLIPILWAIYRLFRVMVDRMTPNQVYFMIRCISLITWNISSTHRLRSYRNLDLCFGDSITKKERARIARHAYQHFILSATDLFLLPRYYVGDKWREIITLTPEFEKKIEELREYDGPVAFHTGHCGSWELTAGFAGILGKKLDLVYRPIDIPQFEAELRKLRTFFGNEAYTKQGALRGYTRTLRKGGWLGVIADQNAGRSAAFLDFFGIAASTEVSYFKLYQRFQPRVIALFAFRDGFKFKFHFEGFFEDHVNPDADEIEEAMRLGQWYTSLMEKMARKYPEQYLWSHKRFAARPGDAPKFYENMREPLSPELLSAQPKPPIPPRRAQRNA